MNNKILLTKILIFALVLNFIGIAFLVLRKPPKRHKPMERVIEILNLEESQIRKYKDLITIHRQFIQKEEIKMGEMKQALFSGLIMDTINEQQILQAIGRQQAKLDSSFYYHFHDIKSICTQDQLPKYKEMVGQLQEIFSRNKLPK